MLMQKLLLLLLSLAAVPAVATAATTATTDRLDEILAEMQKAGAELKTLAANFEQTDHDFILDEDDVSKGRLYLRLPGRIRFEHLSPAPKVLLIRDERVRLYNATSNQVMEFDRGKGGSSGADLLIGFGTNNDKIGENYDASLVEETDEAVVLKLLPKPGSAASMFAYLELTIAKKTWTPIRSVFHEHNRDHTVILFQNTIINGVLPNGAFELDLPSNVEIIRN
ncbi:MAG: outer membrane lipoprotein carrier protein LolA [Acidobacteria bacterium]|nr:MAG: outer membrane lipoprotein carrier protein LolA [Acidobacteriota bacterium]